MIPPEIRDRAVVLYRLMRDAEIAVFPCETEAGDTGFFLCRLGGTPESGYHATPLFRIPDDPPAETWRVSEPVRAPETMEIPEGIAE